MANEISNNADVSGISRENQKSINQQNFINDNFIPNSNGEKTLSPISAFFQKIFNGKNTLSQQESDFTWKMEADRSQLQTDHKNAINSVTMKFSGQLEKLSQAISIDKTDINENNIALMQEKLSDLIKNDEWVEKMIDLKVGDKVIWNQEKQSLMINSLDGKNKFSIRFSEETPEERAASEELAKVEQAREDVENQWQKLWDWIVNRGAFPGRKNSCGASCGELLNQFGFRSILRQNGRDGKNWDTIIEQDLGEYFNKIPIGHPDDAPAGSMLVFGEGAKLWSRARSRHGHVEIKGSDGMYYSYYRSVNAAGSSRTPEKDPEKYKTLTGFTGYAYVYNGKKPPR